MTPIPGLCALYVLPIRKIKFGFILGTEEAVARVAEHVVGRG